MNKLAIIETSERLGISATQCRYWCKLLEIAITKEGRISFIPAGSENLLSAMKQAVDSGISPAVAAIETKATCSPPPPMTQQLETGSGVAERIADLEKAVMLLAEQNKLLNDQNKSMIAILQNQSLKLDNLTFRLLPSPVSKPLPVKVWQPAEKKAPQVNLLKRIWLELFNPTMLRATP